MKKVLSWVLVLALVLSSFTMAFAAEELPTSDDMKDAGAIQNVEAVDVMVATGIIGGYPDGYYYPEKAVTRAEMAKMISVAVNGGEDVGAYYAAGCTFADSVNHWAAGYIAYCANEGIIDGRDANTFDPDATVTGLEAAKMMLVALGYDSKIEGYTGDQWAGNVLKAAKANELFDGCDDFVAGAALDRDNAAQIIFNGLQAPMVGYAFDAEISTGDTTITVNTSVGPTGGVLYEDAFDGDLAPGSANADDFGRPAHSWAYNDEPIGTYADGAVATFVVTEDGSIKNAIENDYDEDFYDENAVTERAMNGGNVSGVLIGDVIELYDLDKVNAQDKNAYKAVVVRYELVQIAVDTDVTDEDAEEGISAYIEVGSVDTNDVDLAGYDADTYVDEAVIAVAYNEAKDAVLDSYVPEVVTGELTKYYDDSVYVDGVEYLTASAYDESALTIEYKYDFYLINGYVFGQDVVEEISDTLYGVYLDKATPTDDFSDDLDTIVKIVDTNGDKVVYTVDEDCDLQSFGEDDALVAYELNDDGEIKAISKAAANTNFNKEMKTNGVLNGKTVAEDVVVFYLNDDEWEVYGYADLEAAETVDAASYIMNDDEMAAVLLATALTDTTDDVFGFITAVSPAKDADGYYDTVTAFVAGEEVTYDSVAKSTEGAKVAVDKAGLVKITLNADNEIEAVEYADCQAVEEVSDDFTGYEVAFLKGVGSDSVNAVDVAKDTYAVAEKSGTSINIGSTENKNYQDLNGAVVYFYNAETQKLEISKFSSIKVGYDVLLFQTSEDAPTWDLVVFQK